MKKRTKISLVLSSAAAILLAGSIMAGGTYALFTSESKTNIAVNSGKVDVSATIDGLTTYTGEDLTGVVEDDESKIKPSTEYESLQNGQFMNGGTASYDEVSNTLTLDKMTPGDKVTFNINLTNNDSNVKFKYQTIISCESDDGLLSGLEFKINSTKFDGLNNKSDWIDGDGLTTSVLNCSVFLPCNAGNEYQGKSCKVSYTIKAVQGNASTSNPDTNVIEIDNAAQLGFFRDSVNKGEFNRYIGKEVKLTNSINLNNTDWTPIKWSKQQAFTFNGNYKTISYFTADVGTDGRKASGLFSEATCATIKNLTVDHATIVGTNMVAVIAGNGLCAHFDNCHVTESSVTCLPWLNGGSYDDGDKAGAIVGQLSAQHSASITDCSVDGFTVQAYRDLGGLAGHVQYSGSTVTGNTVKNATIRQDFAHDYETDASRKTTVGKIVGRQDGSFSLDTEKNTEGDNVTIEKINEVGA